MIVRPGLFSLLFLVAACSETLPPRLDELPPTASNLAAARRVSGRVGTPSDSPPAEIAFGTASPAVGARAPADVGAGQFSLDFADTDIREVVAQILGTMLNVNYTIDPAVRGTVTLRTSRPLTRGQLLPTLETLVGSTGAVVLQSQGIYRVIPAAGAGAAGSLVIPLRYVSAEELAKVLAPLAGSGVKIAADPTRNALLVSGDPSQYDSLSELVRNFDVEALSGQSYALLPASSGSARDFADALREAFRGPGGAALTGLVRVVPMTRQNAVLVISAQPRYIEAARRVYALVERQRRQTVRSWHVYYLQNSHANDIAYTLQMAFTPGNVTATPTDGGQNGAAASRLGSGIGGGLASGGIGGGGGGGGGLGGQGSGGGGPLGGSISRSNPLQPGGGRPPAAAGGASGGGVGAGGNPLLGGLDPSGGSSVGEGNPETMRILPSAQNNAVLIYGTPQEEDTVIAMLRKVDILPLQVLVDATIAEVTLNDQLQYGTQFFFKAGGINAILNTAVGPLGNPAATVLGTAFPGFFIGGKGLGGAPLAISALQAVTTVRVLSSPQLVVVDNQPARLQVGALVPYLTGSSQSTLAANAPVINSINYQPTGVIMQVTPRVNSGGLVTLDISQEVSDVDTTTPKASGIDSPTFQQRNVTTRVVVQDGQTVGIAGLIRDNIGRSNEGIPWLKDIPVLGFLAGTQNNQRSRTELLILLTPHVMRDQRETRALTDDMREGLRDAAATPGEAARLGASGSADPNAEIRARVRRSIEKW